jgi:hypothetical protein
MKTKEQNEQIKSQKRRLRYSSQKKEKFQGSLTSQKPKEHLVKKKKKKR